MTEEIFRDDAYAKTCEATITRAGEYGSELDQTVLYPAGGRQPGDTGILRTALGAEGVRAASIP